MLLQVAVSVLAVILTVVLLRKSVNIGIIMFLNSIFVAVAAGMPVGTASKALVEGVFSEKTIGIIAVLILIMMVENIMRNTGMIKQMVSSLREIIRSKKAAAVVLPAVLGLLPSPGGARFSCPMVEEVVKDSADQQDKAFMNFWFRHIWRDGFILYPGVILASELTNIPVIKLFLHILIFIILHVIVGLVFIRNSERKKHIKTAEPGKAREENIESRESNSEHIKGFIKGFFPIVFIICLYLILLNFLEYSLQIAGIATVVMLLVYRKYGWNEIKKLIKEAFSFKYMIIILGVMVFNQFLSSSGVIDSWIKAISYYHIPEYALFILLPFIAGFTSGISLSFVSITFPILIPLGLDNSIWNVVMAYVAGFSGVMSTPIHLCGVMSADYFGVKVSSVFKRAAMGEVFMMVSVIVLAAALYFL